MVSWRGKMGRSGCGRLVVGIVTLWVRVSPVAHLGNVEPSPIFNLDSALCSWVPQKAVSKGCFLPLDAASPSAIYCRHLGSELTDGQHLSFYLKGRVT